MIIEASGIWLAEARLSAWDESGDGVVFLARKGQRAGAFDVYRFPVGWRGGAIDRSELPRVAKALAHRVMRRLP